MIGYLVNCRGEFTTVYKIVMLKADLRAHFINKRNELHGADRLKLDDLLLIQFQQINFEGIQTVLSYWPMTNKSEPNTHLFNGYLRHMIPQLQLAYPVVQNQEKMQAILVNEDTVYQTNQWGITEPKTGESIKLIDIDLILVPLLVFDEAGYRVGFGKGYYDRYLAEKEDHTALIGFSYFDPIPLISDTHEFDIPLHLGITPKRIYEF
jgi:5-formyltetrahydrofolate cyclo-ligase